MSELFSDGSRIYDPALAYLLDIQKHCKGKDVDDTIKQGIDKAVKLMQVMKLLPVSCPRSNDFSAIFL